MSDTDQHSGIVADQMQEPMGQADGSMISAGKGGVKRFHSLGAVQRAT